MVATTREVVLLEWRPLPPEFENRERAIARLVTTSTLLQIPRPGAMRTFDRPGYVVDREGRAALVYRFPAGAAREVPTPLLRLLEAAENGRDAHRPALDDRYALALALAETVFRLHKRSRQTDNLLIAKRLLDISLSRFRIHTVCLIS
jgi:hypothetical protein